MPLVQAGSKPLSLSPSACTGQAPIVFLNMEGDFMKPVISIVDELLEAGVNVTVYNGQLDLIVDTMGSNRSEGKEEAVLWMELAPCLGEGSDIDVAGGGPFSVTCIHL